MRSAAVRADEGAPTFDEDNAVGAAGRDAGFGHQAARRLGLQGRKPDVSARVSRDDEPDEAVAEVADTVEQHHRARCVVVHGAIHGAAQTDESLWPSFSFFVFRYRRVVSDAGISSGIHSLTDSPYPSIPTSLRGLLLSRRIDRTPRSLRIWTPTP